MTDLHRHRIRRAAAGLAAVVLLLGGPRHRSLDAETAGRSNPDTQEKTVWSGVYTRAQAGNGKTAYTDACSACHLESLAGDSTSPPLVGDDFRAAWDGKKLRALYSRILSTMPVDNPGTLGEKTVLDIVAYLLETNGYPAGTTAVERADELNTILFLNRK